ncbi:hypothetical protein A0H81_02410 [Grifola frondosa]|uniref:Uncharacterized protein n=1 Tax=Grifola frondosa TaxID=5627 RepID=A0A1C7MLH2_GRIFR|nr:hypothetical protein A0H81_02410 [Grifola frondosa]
MHTMWSVRGGGKESNNPGKGKATFTAHSIEKRQDVLRELSRKFDEGPRDDFLCFDQDAVRRLKASYAYKFDFDTAFSHWSRFPWDLAMRPLCEIKAKALGSSKTVTQRFYDKMTLSSSVLNRLGKF